MSKSVRETVEEAMRKLGYYDHPMTIGGSTHYLDADSPFVKLREDIQRDKDRISNMVDDYTNNWQSVRVNVPQNNVQAYNQEVMNRINQGIQQPQGDNNWNGVATSAITGTAEGVFGGINRAANAATLGLYGKGIDMMMGNTYSNLQNRLQQRANQVGLGDFNEVANNVIDAGIGIRFGKKLR